MSLLICRDAYGMGSCWDAGVSSHNITLPSATCVCVYEFTYLAGCAAMLAPGSCLFQGYGGVGDYSFAFLTAHAHTSKPRGCKVVKECQENVENNASLSVRDRRNV